MILRMYPFSEVHLKTPLSVYRFFSNKDCFCVLLETERLSPGCVCLCSCGGGCGHSVHLHPGGGSEGEPGTNEGV